MVEKALERLEDAARKLLASERSLAPESRVDAVQVPLRLRLDETAERARARPDGALQWLGRVRQEIRESLLASAAFERGRVFCLRCENSRCDHALPPGPRSVFAGYGQTGRPEWLDFDQLLARREDPRVEQLYGDRRRLLSCAQGMDELYAELLPGFEELQRRYLILGQLSCGLFSAPHAAEAEPMALTVQIVRTQRGNTQAVLGVNLVGRLAELDARRDVFDEQLVIGLPEALRPLRRALAAAGRGDRKIPTEGIALKRLANRCHTLLKSASRDLEHRHRADGRRTRHARERSDQGDRPTAKALEDARSSSPEQFYEDRDRKTRVVVGSRNRVHVFTPGGKHVTSLTMPGHEIKSKIARRRWVPLRAEALAVLRSHLQRDERS